MKNNLVHDQNRNAMDVMYEMELQEQERINLEAQEPPQAMIINTPHQSANNGESTQENNASLYRDAQPLIAQTTGNEDDDTEQTDISRALQQEEINLIKKIMDNDLDSVEKVGQRKKEIHVVDQDEDEASVDSSVTFGSKHSINSMDSDISMDSQITNKPDTAPKIRGGLSNKDFTALFEKDELEVLTDEEVALRINAWYSYKKGKEKIALDSALANFIEQRNNNVTKPPAETTNEPKQHHTVQAVQSPGSSDNTAVEE